MQHDGILAGEFVNLRPLAPQDAERTLGWRHSQRARYLNQGATDVQAQARWIANRPASEKNYIIERKDGRAIGMVSLVGIDLTHRHAEPARFLIGDEEGAKGIPAAVEAMLLIYRLAFDEMDLLRLHGTIAEENVLMLKWQKYLGMKEEGRMRRHYLINGRQQDAVVLGLLAEEYRKTTLPRMKVLIAAARAAH